MQVVLTILGTVLGGLIAGLVGLLTARYQEERKRKRDLQNLLAEIDRNIKLVSMYMKQVHRKDIATLDTLQTTAFTTANSTGALTPLPEDKRKDIFYAYNQIFIYQNRNEVERKALAIEFAPKTAKSLKKARKALKSTLDKSSWIFRRIL